MRRKFLHDISANSLQVVISQASGLAIFYILSVSFSKNDFGEINWSLAVLLTAFSILSLGMDQMMVKKIAAGADRPLMLSLYFFHVLSAGILFYALLLVAWSLFPGLLQHHHLLLYLGIGKLMIFWASPFKQLANGMEKYKALLWMSVCSNVVRGTALIIVALWSTLTLGSVIVIFIAGDLSEWLLSVMITRKILKIKPSLTWNRSKYLGFLKESLPQAGVVLFTSAIARFDWIFLGLLASNIALAEYSFAFRVFEVATLPLLVVAPVLVPLFTRWLGISPLKLDDKRSADIRFFLRVEMIVASAVSLVLNILWVPVIDFLTQGKYGAVNRDTILILSCTMPFIYANNFLWSVNFSQGKLKMILVVFCYTFLVNVAGNLFLIPFFGGNGAAIAYLSAILLQFALFRRKTQLPGLRGQRFFTGVPLLALASGCLCCIVLHDTWLLLAGSLFIFVAALIFSGFLRKNDWADFRRLTGL